MDIEGTYTLQAAPEDVWRCLMDQGVLLRIVPGIERLEQLDSDSYALALHIKYAPLLGTYHGRATISEQQYPYYFRMSVEDEGRPNTISGTGSIHLHKNDDKTIIAYTGTLSLGKRGTRLPPLVVKGAAKLLLQQFFTALADYIQANQTAHMNGEANAEITTIKQVGGNIVILPHSSSSQSPNIPLKIVQALGLGAHDPLQEELWTKRVRRTGIITGLLLLIWIGTRIPRRQ